MWRWVEHAVAVHHKHFCLIDAFVWVTVQMEFLFSCVTLEPLCMGFSRLHCCLRRYPSGIARTGARTRRLTETSRWNGRRRDPSCCAERFQLRRRIAHYLKWNAAAYRVLPRDADSEQGWARSPQEHRTTVVPLREHAVGYTGNAFCLEPFCWVPLGAYDKCVLHT